MKRISIIVLALIFCATLTLAACGGDKEKCAVCKKHNCTSTHTLCLYCGEYDCADCQKLASGSNGAWDSSDSNSILGYQISIDLDIDEHDKISSIDDLTIEVYVDGVLIDPSNYTVTKGSVVITFTPEFLQTLPAGVREVIIKIENEEAGIKGFAAVVVDIIYCPLCGETEKDCEGHGETCYVCGKLPCLCPDEIITHFNQYIEVFFGRDIFDAVVNEFLSQGYVVLYEEILAIKALMVLYEPSTPTDMDEKWYYEQIEYRLNVDAKLHSTVWVKDLSISNDGELYIFFTTGDGNFRFTLMGERSD